MNDFFDANYHVLVTILIGVIGVVVPMLYTVLVLVVTRRHHRFAKGSFEHLDAVIKGEKRRRDELAHGRWSLSASWEQ
jgi:hypothetical protein